ncbi:MAG: SpoVA/SpoVAEb family sporulation membrane protein [Clostridiales bacterium]|nr:SpoVA/SpoVAEb family sporulation membrane protein [Lachnospiraceae bacterium]MDD6619004.1 SpoVA/SpoVAEb family sporulation membrane protein [Clostridiales bacterium]MDY4770532.1 SpoVA/SpoVAEb family sporulation membrane protein [Lachnospiraceae bacterium]
MKERGKHGGIMAQQKEEQKKYEQYVKEVTPVHSLPQNMAKAFLVGGIICVIGQWILNIAKGYGLDKEMAGAWCSGILILASVILTGLNIYPKLAKFAGAGSLVPITGFANSVAASAIEYQKEGQVMGIGCKIFTIAGPVILYGIVTSWVLGLIYWLFQLM